MIKQKSEYDCALACLAMASGKEYNSIFSNDFLAQINYAKTCDGENLDRAYQLAGFIKDETYRTVYVGNANAPLVRQLLWKRKAIIQVPSINYMGVEHFIYWDGEQILDPSNKHTYKFLGHIFPTYVTLFTDKP